VDKFGVEWFESAYHLFFINSARVGKLLGKNALWQMIVFRRLNKVNFYSYISRLPIPSGYDGNAF
jgi:hypothetical protein